MGVLLSFFFSVSGIQTVVACTVLRRVRNLGATKGSSWQNSASRKEDAQARTRRRMANFTHALISIMQAKILRRVQREQRRNIQ